VDHKQIRRITEHYLKRVDLWSPEAEELVFLTGLVESGYKYIRQLGEGPAVSFHQVEPQTAYDVCKNYLSYREKRAKLVTDALYLPDEAINDYSKEDWEEILWSSIGAGIVFCRLVYRRVPKPLPRIDEPIGMAAYWKTWYNTSKGAGTIDKFLSTIERRKDQ